MQLTVYSLRPAVYACFADGRLVFLDLDRDQYFCLDEYSSSLLSRIYRDGKFIVDDSLSDEEIQGAISELTRKELVIRGDRKPSQPGYIYLESPAQTSLSKPKINLMNVGWLQAWRFCYAMLAAAWKLRFHSMVHILSTVRARKLAQANRTSRETTLRLVVVFWALRPLCPRSYVCLFDSLALLEFLAMYGAYPTWAFGVRGAPFSAHCWLQDGCIVLTDTVERAASFNKIMAW